MIWRVPAVVGLSVRDGRADTAQDEILNHHRQRAAMRAVDLREIPQGCLAHRMEAAGFLRRLVHAKIGN